MGALQGRGPAQICCGPVPVLKGSVGAVWRLRTVAAEVISLWAFSQLTFLPYQVAGMISCTLDSSFLAIMYHRTSFLSIPIVQYHLLLFYNKAQKSAPLCKERTLILHLFLCRGRVRRQIPKIGVVGHQEPVPLHDAVW